jgi:hypothetical protein
MVEPEPRNDADTAPNLMSGLREWITGTTKITVIMTGTGTFPFSYIPGTNLNQEKKNCPNPC